MLLIAISLSLLVVYVGTTLMYRTQLDSLGRFYKVISIFIITMGLVSALFISGMIIFHLCGYFHHKKNHCRIKTPNHRTVSVNKDSTLQMYHQGKCCPHIYCTEHISDYGEESIFYPKNCVCCPDKDSKNDGTDRIH